MTMSVLPSYLVNQEILAKLEIEDVLSFLEANPRNFKYFMMDCTFLVHSALILAVLGLSLFMMKLGVFMMGSGRNSPHDFAPGLILFFMGSIGTIVAASLLVHSWYEADEQKAAKNQTTVLEQGSLQQPRYLYAV